MATSKMFIPAALMGAITGAFALSNTRSTESLAPEQLGSTTIDGAIVYSMNQCSVIHETSCQAFLSTAVTISTTNAPSSAVSTAYESVPYPLPTTSEFSTPGEGTPTVTTSGQATTSAAQISESQPASSSEGGNPTGSETAPPGANSAARAMIGGLAQAAVMSTAVAGVAIFWLI